VWRFLFAGLPRCSSFLFGGSLTGKSAGAAFYFQIGKHSAAALGSAAIAVAGIFEVGVVEVVLVDKFFAGGDVAGCDDVDMAAEVFGFAVGVAGVIEEHACAEAVDDLVALADAEEVSNHALGVADVGEVFREAWAVVLENALTATDGVECDAAGSVDSGGLDQKTRRSEGFCSAGHGVEYSKGTPVERCDSDELLGKRVPCGAMNKGFGILQGRTLSRWWV